MQGRIYEAIDNTGKLWGRVGLPPLPKTLVAMERKNKILVSEQEKYDKTQLNYNIALKPSSYKMSVQDNIRKKREREK